MPGALAWLILGCAPAPEPAPATGVDAALDAGWIAQVVADPAAFTATIDGTGRDGWVLLHQGRLAGARAALSPGPARGRAALEQAWLYQDLALLAAEAWPALATTWAVRDPAVVQGPLPSLAAAATLVAGGEVDLSGLPAQDQPWLEALRAAAQGQPVTAPGSAPDEQGCLLASTELLAGLREAAPEDCAPDAPLQLQAAGTFYDPTRYAAAAAAHRRAAAAALQGATDQDLSLLLFGSWWAAADLAAARGGDGALPSPPLGDGPTLAALALPDPGPDDAPQAARERVRALDQALDDWERRTRDTASPDGAALLSDLALVPQARGRILVAWARNALEQGRPHQATAYLMLAHDVEQARELGPRNPPSLFALSALAAMRTGRTREALDHLGALQAEHPDVRGLDETIGDLAVLEGMDRQGDSKEN